MFVHITLNIIGQTVTKKDNAFLIQTSKGAVVFRNLWLPDLKTIGTWRWESYQSPLPSGKYSWCSFLLGADSTARP